MNNPEPTCAHSGGTCTPTPRVRSRVWTADVVTRAPEAVPHRAPRDATGPQNPAELRGSRASCLTRGTEGHDGPQAIVRVHGRAS